MTRVEFLPPPPDPRSRTIEIMHRIKDPAYLEGLAQQAEYERNRATRTATRREKGIKKQNDAIRAEQLKRDEDHDRQARILQVRRELVITPDDWERLRSKERSEYVFKLRYKYIIEMMKPYKSVSGHDRPGLSLKATGRMLGKPHTTMLDTVRKGLDGWRGRGSK